MIAKKLVKPIFVTLGKLEKIVPCYVNFALARDLTAATFVLSGFFPVAINFLRRIPVIGTLLNLPGISTVLSYLHPSGLRPILNFNPGGKL
jgi:hypothetical protein